MKKIIIPVIIAAVLGVGSGVTAVLVNRANTATANYLEGEIVDLEVKSGTYYLNGDKNAELWFEATPDHLILKGKDVDKSIKNAIIEDLEEGSMPFNDDDINATLEITKMLYCGEKIYVAEYVNMEYPYWLLISRDNSEKDRSELKENSSAAAAWAHNDKTNTIKTGLFGEFTLVE